MKATWVYAPDLGFCSCERMKLVRQGTDKCEPCWAVINYKNGRYRNMRIFTPGDVVTVQGMPDSYKVERAYRRDPNAPVTLLQLEGIPDLVYVSEVLEIIG